MLINCCWEHKMLKVLWKKFHWFPIRQSIHLPYNSVILLLDIFSKEVSAHVPGKICMWMFIAALLRMPQLETTQRSSNRTDVQVVLTATLESRVLRCDDCMLWHRFPCYIPKQLWPKHDNQSLTYTDQGWHGGSVVSGTDSYSLALLPSSI